MGNNAIDQYIEVILGKVCTVCPHNAQCEKGLTYDKNKDYLIPAGIIENGSNFKNSSRYVDREQSTGID